jgi:hypothetical protein
MKYLFLILVLASILFTGCKKDPDPLEIPIPDNKLYEERFKIITSHYWRLSEKWQDTTAYGKAHPELIPLPSSTNVYVFTDSCQYYTCSKYSIYGQYYTVKPYGCGGCGTSPSCEVFENMPWSLSKDANIFYGPTEVTNVLTVNDTIVKRYQIRIYNFTKKLVEVYVDKAYEF